MLKSMQSENSPYCKSSGGHLISFSRTCGFCGYNGHNCQINKTASSTKSKQIKEYYWKISKEYMFYPIGCFCQHTLWVPATTTNGTACFLAASATMFNPTGPKTPPLAITAWTPTTTFTRSPNFRQLNYIHQWKSKAFEVGNYHVHSRNHCKNCRISNQCSL